MCFDLTSLFQYRGISQKYDAQANADIAAAAQKDQLADMELSRQREEVGRERDNADRLAGRQIATFAENGVQIDGTALDVIQDSAREADKDADIIRRSSAIKQQNLGFEAHQLRTRAGNTRKAKKYAIFDKAIGKATQLVGSF